MGIFTKRCADERARITQLTAELELANSEIEALEQRCADLEGWKEQAAALAAQVRDLQAKLADCEAGQEPPPDEPPADPPPGDDPPDEPPVDEEGAFYGAGRNVQVNPGARRMVLTRPSESDLRAILLADGDRVLDFDPGLSGPISLSENTILRQPQSGLQVRQWPNDLHTANGQGQVDLIQFGEGGGDEANIVKNIWVDEWPAYGGASHGMESSRFVDNFAFTAVQDSYFAHIISLGTVDKATLGVHSFNNTFDRCIFGGGLGDPDPPHHKKVQHNRTFSMYAHGLNTFGWCLFGPDDWRVMGNLKGAGLIEFFGCIGVLTGRHGSQIGRKTVRGANDEVIFLDRPATANFSMGCEWHIQPGATVSYLFDGEGQNKNPDGALGAASIWLHPSSTVVDHREGVNPLATFSPTAEAHDFRAVDANPGGSVGVIDLAAAAGQFTLDYVLENAGPRHKSPIHAALIEAVRGGYCQNVWEDVSEILSW